MITHAASRNHYYTVLLDRTLLVPLLVPVPLGAVPFGVPFGVDREAYAC